METTAGPRKTAGIAVVLHLLLGLALIVAGCGGDDGPAGPAPSGNEPTACFAISPNPGEAGTSFLFDARCSVGDTDSTLTYKWDFDGDGAFETSLGALGFTQQVYPNAGTYSIALEILDSADNLADTTSAELVVTPANLPPDLQHLTTDAFTDGGPAWSPDGTKIAFQSNRSGNLDLWVIDVDARGGLTQITSAPETDAQPAWSPDGTKIAFQSTREDPSGDIWILDVATQDAVRLTTVEGVEESPTWSPDGVWIAYSSDGGGTGTRDIWKIAVTGGSPVQVTTAETFEADPAWSPSGAWIAYQVREGAQWRIEHIDPDGTYPTPVTSPAVVAFVGHPTWSPASDFVAFQSNSESDVLRIAVTGGSVVNLTNDPAVAKEPSWSPDGARIAFVSTRTGNEDLWILTLP